MMRHRVIVNIPAATVVPVTTEAIEIEPGRAYVRAHDGSLRPMDVDGFFSGDAHVSTGWHEDLPSAYAEAADELGRRAQALAALRLIVDAKKEVAVHV